MGVINKNDKSNEATRVQMPVFVHLTRLGYEYFGKISEEMAGMVYDLDTNILKDIFKQQFYVLNSGQEVKGVSKTSNIFGSTSIINVEEENSNISSYKSIFEGFATIFYTVIK